MIGVFLAPGFEEIEALTVVDVLKRAKVGVKTVSINEELYVEGAHGISVCADESISKFDFAECEMIVLPGGMPGTTNLHKNTLLVKQIKDFVSANKWVCAICAAPMILGEEGLLKDKAATIYPGMEKYLIGANYSNDSVVIDGKIITAKGPGKAMDFALTIVEVLLSKDVRASLERSLVL